MLNLYARTLDQLEAVSVPDQKPSDTGLERACVQTLKIETLNGKDPSDHCN